MAVSLEDIKKLREQLGTGMVDTKNALEEADGDVEKATEILRLKGAKGNAKRADRSTARDEHDVDGERLHYCQRGNPNCSWQSSERLST